ncbi:hypothetical protein KSP40_PGU007475 [Platanthera guangdongensis]|uniref:Uncharacterized protein n=1 Tax=Platanthera guangdongensis TaxID=2320717 RepID=A0ABR2LHM6_9ASPA
MSFLVSLSTFAYSQIMCREINQEYGRGDSLLLSSESEIFSMPSFVMYEKFSSSWSCLICCADFVSIKSPVLSTLYCHTIAEPCMFLVCLMKFTDRSSARGSPKRQELLDKAGHFQVSFSVRMSVRRTIRRWVYDDTFHPILKLISVVKEQLLLDIPCLHLSQTLAGESGGCSSGDVRCIDREDLSREDGHTDDGLHFSFHEFAPNASQCAGVWLLARTVITAASKRSYQHVANEILPAGGGTRVRVFKKVTNHRSLCKYFEEKVRSSAALAGAVSTILSVAFLLI